MEKKKTDINSLVGFLLIGGILMWMLYMNKPTEEEIQQKEAETEAASQQTQTPGSTSNDIRFDEAMALEGNQDSLAMEQLKNRLGSFAYSATLPSASDEETILENDVLFLKVSNKGGYITEAKLKKHTQFNNLPVYLIKDGNAGLNLQFSSENRTLNTQDLYFEPTLSQNGEDKVLSMKLKTSENSYIEYRYTLHPGEYMMDFGINSQ